jgi:hypothetical protein
MLLIAAQRKPVESSTIFSSKNVIGMVEAHFEALSWQV